MAVKIKLQRIGAKNRPYFRVIAQEEGFSPHGKIIEVLGQYQTRSSSPLFQVDKEKVLSWISKGAKPTEKVRILLGKAGILPPLELSALPKKKPKKEMKEVKEESKTEEPMKEKKESAEGGAKEEKQ